MGLISYEISDGSKTICNGTLITKLLNRAIGSADSFNCMSTSFWQATWYSKSFDIIKCYIFNTPWQQIEYEMALSMTPVTGVPLRLSFSLVCYCCHCNKNMRYCWASYRLRTGQNEFGSHHVQTADSLCAHSR